MSASPTTAHVTAEYLPGRAAAAESWVEVKIPAARSVLLAAQELRAHLHGLDDVDVAGAAAEVALEPLVDLLVGGIGVVLQQPRRRHDHARRAEAALKSVALRERALDRVELPLLRHALDRHDARPVRLRREHGARFHRPAVNVHGAAAALAGIAADVRAGELELVAQEIHEQRAVLDRLCVILAVYLDGDLGHFQIPGFK